MAPKFPVKFTIFFLLFSICLSTLPVQVLAESATTHEQVIKFYLDPALVPDLNFARTVLPRYVEDMNLVLSKNTNRRLVFDPETGIILTSVKPHSDSAKPPLPTEDFEIWAHVTYTSNAVSYGGYAGMDRSGAGVLAGLKWTRLYDPDNLETGLVTDYTIQLDHMLHELAHVFGAGIGEYYSLTSITDTTAISPLLDIRLSDPGDSYWSDKPDFMADPLLRFTNASSRADYLARVQYSTLTAAVINGPYRNGIPSLEYYTIQVLDDNGNPVSGANVKVWNVRGYAPYQSELLFDTFSDENGEVSLPWGGSGSAHTAANFLRLIKVYKDGRSIVKPRYLSIFEMDSAMLVSQVSSVTLTLSPGLPEVATFASAGKHDGWILESSQNSQKGASLNYESGSFLLGDDVSNRQYRSILSFNTEPLPDNAIITKVSIKILKQGSTGVDPFTTHGGLQVHVRQGYFSTKASLQRADFQAASSQSEVASLTAPPADNWYEFELDAQTYLFINLTGNSQLRLQFDLGDDSDRKADFIKFFSGNATDPTKRPQLIIEYYLP